MKPLLTLTLLALLISCHSQPRPAPSSATHLQPASATRTSARQHRSVDEIILLAERSAKPAGRSVLQTGRIMTLVNREIVRGSCWDYANEVFNRAGYPNRGRSRLTVFKGTKKRGPYAAASQFEAGDFLYYINHSYGDIEHSAIFVDWIDYGRREALMLSYGGERRNAPARYRAYDLSHVYRIVRAGERRSF